MLCILNGGSFLDMALLFKMSFNHVHKTVRYVINEWILHPRFYPIKVTSYCFDNDAMNEVALQFLWASKGVINGCIGALDGWIVKIKNQ